MSYILENDVLKLECIEAGGEMQHLIKKSNGEEVLYQGDQAWSGKNPSLFPIVGSTYTKDYKIDGKTYSMKNHGLIRYATLKNVSSKDALIFTLDADENTLAQYPFDFHYEIKYELIQNKVKISYLIQNKDKKDMPFGFGLHPGFKLNDSFESYTLKFSKHEECKRVNLDDNTSVPVSFSEWKLSREDLKKYATLVYKELKSDCVTLYHHENKCLSVYFEGFPFLALWSHEKASDYICIEPWYSHADFGKVDCDFYHREGTIVLKSKETWSCCYSIEIFN